MLLLLLSLILRVAGYFLWRERQRGLEGEGGQHLLGQIERGRRYGGCFTSCAGEIPLQAGVCFPRATCSRPCENLESGKGPCCLLQPSAPQTGRQTNMTPGGSPNTQERGEGLPEQKPSSGSPQGQNNLLIESTRQHTGEAAGGETETLARSII